MLNAKYKLIKSKTLGQDDRVDAIISNLDPELTLLYNKALTLNISNLKRSYINSALLAEKDLSKISILLEIPLEVIEIYEEFFFNVTELDKLSKLEYIETVEDTREKTLNLWSLGCGNLSFLSWRMGNKTTISPIENLQEIHAMTAWKAKEALYSSNTAESSKEAIKWSKLSVDTARLVKAFVMDTDAAKQDLALAIAEVVPNFMGLDQLLEENKNV